MEGGESLATTAGKVLSVNPGNVREFDYEPKRLKKG